MSATTTLAPEPITRPTQFLDLPKELRCMIYRELFSSGTFRLKEQMQPRWTLRTRPEAHHLLKAVFDQKLKEQQDMLLEATVFLRSGHEYIAHNDCREPSATAIFETCSLIMEEALPVFYHDAQIHWSIRAQLPLSIGVLQENLHRLRYLSVDFSFITSACPEGNVTSYVTDEDDRDFQDYELDNDSVPNHDTELTEREIAECLELVALRCHSLSTFTLHLLSDRCCISCDVDLVQKALMPRYQRDSRVSKALARIVVRDTVAVVAMDTQAYQICDRPYNAILTPLAHFPDNYPGHDPIYDSSYIEQSGHHSPQNASRDFKWSVLHLRAWPQISLHKQQEEAILDFFEEREGEGGIRMWYLQPQGSKHLVLPSKLKSSRRQWDFDYYDDDEQSQAELENPGVSDDRVSDDDEEDESIEA